MVAQAEVPVRIKLRRGNWQAYHSTAREVVVEGPARTGKTFAILLRMNKNAQRVSGYRGLIVRKVAVTLGATVLRTLEEDVLHEWDSYSRSSKLDGVHFFGGNQHEPQAYVYENGSHIVVGGMDQPTKILGSEYDEIFYNEVIEGTEEDVETLQSRLSHGLLDEPAFLSDCNPSHVNHWVLSRIGRGRTEHIKTTLKDNPAFFDDDGEPTERGRSYMESLSGLTGSRYQRLVLGEWVGVENALYPHFDRRLHVRPLEEGLRFSHGAIGGDYGRRHNAAAVPVRVDQFGRRWVFEAWAQPDIQHGRMTEREIGRMRGQYQIRKVRVGPDMDIMVGVLGAEESGIAEGARRARVNEVAFLLNVFPGGVVPSSREDAYNKPPAMVTPTGDSPGLLLVEGAPGIDELASEMEAYHEVRVANDRKDELVIARIFDDRVSALEYACEELQQAPMDWSKRPANRPMEVVRR